MIRRNLSWIVVAILLPIGVAAQAPTPRDSSLERALVALEKDSWRAWKGRDSAFFRGFLSDDHVEVGFRGTADKGAVVQVVASPACVVRSYEVGQFHVTRFNAATALVTYHATQETTCSGTKVPSPVWVSSLYVLRNGKWLNAVYQQSQDTR